MSSRSGQSKNAVWRQPHCRLFQFINKYRDNLLRLDRELGVFTDSLDARQTPSAKVLALQIN